MMNTTIINRYPSPGKGSLSSNRPDFHADVKKVCANVTSLETSKAEKVILIGDASVGKTSLVRRYCENTYTEGYKATIGVDFVFKQYNIIGRDFTLHIWDTAGQEQFRCVSKSYFRGSSAAIVCFDLGSPASLQNAQGWLSEVKAENNNDMLVFLVGLKSDSFHEVSEKEGEEAALRMQAEYWEVSSKLGDNVRELFERLVIVLFEESILSSLQNPSQGKGAEIGHLALSSSGVSRTKKKKNKCCS